MKSKKPETIIKHKQKTSNTSGLDPMMKGRSMMKKMMPSAQKSAVEGDGGPMQKMMKMCSEMLSSIDNTSSMAVFSTHELRSIFLEWFDRIEFDAMEVITKQKETNLEALASSLKMSKESTIYIVYHLIIKNKINISIKLGEC